MNLMPLYIDVAVMSATIEAIVGVVIAVSAFLIIRFRKAKKKVQETLHLEDKKETEEEVVLLNEEVRDDDELLNRDNGDEVAPSDEEVASFPEVNE